MTEDEIWLRDFHAGDRAILERCYRDHFEHVERTVARFVQGADLETLIHEVFYRLLSSPALRQRFTGGSLPAWLYTVSRNHALDYLRRRGREVPLSTTQDPADATDFGARERADAQLLIQQFRNERLPEKWHALFQVRFLDRLSQRDAATKLGIRRTTLAYQEFRVSQLLKKFLLESEPS